MSKEKSTETLVHKVILGSKKEVLLRDMKIKHQKLAAKIAGSKAGDNKAYLAAEMQEELLKMLVVQVDGKKLTAAQLESLDDTFSLQEYGQLMKVIEKFMGGDSLGEPQMEIVPGGAA